MKKLLFGLLIVNAFVASAQVPVLVVDMYPGATHSTPGLTTVFNNKLYYAANDPVNGRELRVWDGINAPAIVYNINPGATNAFYSTTNGKNMAVLNGKLYFGANNGSIGSELMVYDGTNTPSVVADIVPGATGSDPYDLFSDGSRILFDAHSAADGYELFVYDGVNPPTMFDIFPGASSGDPQDFTLYNNKIYFKATNAAAGTELFVYDPSNNSVTLAADIVPGGTSSMPGKFMVLGNKLYFIASTIAYGMELYSYDGTTATRLTDINPGGDAGVNTMLVAYNNQIYFGGAATGTEYQLYKYDPATNIASLVYNINPGNSAMITTLIVYGSKLYFNAETAASGDELWVHDGSTTTLLADIDPGIWDSTPREFVILDNKLCFGATNATTGNELYSLTDPALGVQNIKLDGRAVLTPNPTSGDATLQLSLNSAATLSIQLTDISGKMIWSKEPQNYEAGESNVIIPSGEQAVGTYFYRVSDNRGVLMASGKFTKQ